MITIEMVDISTILHGTHIRSNTIELFNSIDSLKVGEAIKWTYDEREQAVRARERVHNYLVKKNLIYKYVYHQAGNTLSIGRVK